jgi:hypothetical protein
VIHKRVLQAVLESEVMIADLSTKNPNVIYDLGIRHAVQRGRTISIGNQAAFPLPFNLNNLFVQRYEVGADGILDRDQALQLRGRLKDVLDEETTAPPSEGRLAETRIVVERGHVLHDLADTGPVVEPRADHAALGHILRQEGADPGRW